MTTSKDLPVKLAEYHQECRSWRRVGEAIGQSSGYAWRVVKGTLTASQSACEMWDYFITGQKPTYVMVQACPTCGQSHGNGLDCHGQQVVLALLAPGERIAPAGAQIVRRNKQLKRWRDLSVNQLAAAIRARKEYHP